MTPHDTPPLLICPKCGRPTWDPEAVARGYCGDHTWAPPTPKMIESLYIPAWESYLAYGDFQSQEASLYALRSHGWEAWGLGYGEEFYWEIRHPDSEFFCRIDPQVKR